MAVKEKKPRPKRVKAKQGFLPDMEPERLPVLDEAAEVYYDAMLERVALSNKEAEAKDSLIEKMIELGKASYTTPDGLVITATSKTNVAVKKKDDKKENEDGDEA